LEGEVKNWDFQRPIFPLVNLPTSLFQNALEGLPPDVYFDWAVLEASQDDSNGEINGRNVPHKAVVNFEYSPMFEGQENSETIVKAHLILDESIGGFYSKTLQLELVGFLQQEQKISELL
jgi:FAD synthase